MMSRFLPTPIPSISNLTKNDEAKTSGDAFLLTHYEELRSETKLIGRALICASNQERILLISAFNKKWGERLTMTYVIDSDTREGWWKVIDKKDNSWTMEGYANNISIDPNLNADQISTSNGTLVFKNSSDRITVIDSDVKSAPNDINHNLKTEISNNKSNFWKKKLPVAATALAIAVGVSATVYSMTTRV